MNPLTATIVFIAGMIGLLVLDRDPKARTSFALWIPMVWLCIGGSRVASAWFYPSAADPNNPYLEGNPLDRNIQTVLLVLALFLSFLEEAPRCARFCGQTLRFLCFCAIAL